MLEKPAETLSDHGCILVVDDDLSSLSFMGVLLELEGFEVHTAINYGSAIQEVQRRGMAFDLFILDVNIDAACGRELCRELKELFPAIPILFCSAFAFPDCISASLSECGDQFLVKPVPTDKLVQVVRSCLVSN